MKKLNLKCEGVQLWGDRQTWRRYKQTLKRVKPFIGKDKYVADIGGFSEFGIRMANELELFYFYSKGDLNYGKIIFNEIASLVEIKPDDHYFEYAFCFEVIEHLINPLLMLRQVFPEKYLFITYPYSPILQGKRHFHEFTVDQFYTLVDEAGLKVVHHDSFRNYLNWWKYFCGIRPLIKLVMQLLGLSKIHFWVLERK